MKRLLIALGVLVVLLVAAAVVAPLVVPTEVYKSRIIALVKASTGRDFTISGPVKLSLLPHFALEANDVALANAPGGIAAQMARLKELQVQLRLFPLLRGAVEVGQFVLVQPVIALEVDKQGHPNWVFATGPMPAATPAAPAAAGNATLSTLSLGDVRLDGGKISYLDQRSGQSQEIDDIDLKLSLADLNSPFAGDGSAVWNQQKVALSIAVGSPGALLHGGASAVNLNITSTPVNLKFDGEMTALPPEKLGGAIDIAVPSVRGLAKWVGSPVAMGGTGLGPLAIKGKIDAAGAKFAFSDATITLDAIKAKGELAVDGSGARPSLKGRLDVERLDLNPYLPPEGATGQTGAPAASGAAGASSTGWSTEPIDLAPLKTADADFAIGTRALVYRKIELGNSALELNLKDGKLTTNLTELALYRGKGKGSVTLDGSGAEPAIAASFDLSQVQIEPLLAAAAGTDRLSGTGTFAISVSGRGHSQSELVSALNGNGSLNLANGQIRGVNLVALAQTAVSDLTRGALTGNITEFGSVTGTYTISKGILRNEDLRLTSGLVPMRGAGTVDLPHRTVDYRLTVQAAGAVPVPILVSGPWDNLSYRPDVTGVLQDVVKQPGQVLEQLKTVVPKGSGSGILPANPLKGILGK